jgi:HSP20 family protein
MATNFDPFRHVVTLSDAVNRLMQDAVMRPGYAISRGGEVPMNVVERPDQYLIQVALPGVRVEDVSITSEQHTLTIQANRKNTLPTEAQSEQMGYLLAEFGPGEFTRSVTLPKEFDADGIQAEFLDGILTITIPVAQRAQPKRIPISGASREPQLAASANSQH